MEPTTFQEIIRFFIQVSIAVGGAASLWGFVLAYLAQRAKSAEDKEGFYRAAYSVMPLFVLVFFSFLALWWFGFLVAYPQESLAHEGIVQGTLGQYIINGFQLNVFFVVALMLTGMSGIALYWRKPKNFARFAALFYLSQFVLFSLISLFFIFTKELDKQQFVFFLHNWHSILTIGTIVTVEFLYLTSMRSRAIQRVLYPFFPTISLFIWVGLGLEFAGSFLAFEGYFPQTTQFIFNQAVIAIIILNGALLSGRINDALINLVRRGKEMALTPRLRRAAQISGAVSIVSWTTVTFLDFFDFNVSLGHFFIFYLAAIFLVFLLEPIIERPLAALVRRMNAPDLVR